MSAVPAVWNDPGVDWASFDAVVVRETWDYSDHHDAFVAWVHRVEAVTTLLNTASVIEWNTDKRYLRELAAAGVPVVPTRFLEPGDASDDWLPEGDSEELVIKPAISCGSRNTMRYHRGEDIHPAGALVERLLDEGRTVMVQPYLDAVDTLGETALIFFDGVFSHAIRKGPLLARGIEGDTFEGLFVQEQIDPREPSDAERRVAQQVIDAIPGGPCLYARVDLIPAASGLPVLLELELTEPSLFLSHSAGAPDRLAAAIAQRVSG